MPLYGKIYVIRRNGTDGSQFPLTSRSCLFGRRLDCDIRIQLPTVSNEHCRLEAGENGEFELQNLSPNQTKVNGDLLKGSTIVRHKDVFTIHDRSFRFEYPENTAFCKTPAKEATKKGTPGKKTPLREIQASNPGNDSPFGALVNDMKKSLKSTPKKSKPKSGVENAENFNSGKKKKERKSIDKRKSKSPGTRTNTNPQDAVAISCENTADLANINQDLNKTTVTSVPDDNSNNSGFSSLNSSGTVDSLNKGMINSTISEESETSVCEEKSKRRKSRRSSLRKSLPTTSNEESPVSNESEVLTEKDEMLILETMKAVQKSPRPVIKTSTEIPKDTPTISLTTSTDCASEEQDPYDFTSSPPGTSPQPKSPKNYRRRSSGSCGMSRKKALLTMGSPRISRSTPLHDTLEDYKRKSIPLVEDVEEIENNSSPIKKPPSRLHTFKTPSILFKDTPVAVRKSRRVSFGPQLSPEEFHKELPPNTPVKKGALAPIPLDISKPLLPSRKSVSFCPPSSLEPVEELAAEDTTPVTTRRVSRTPTPFKPASDKPKHKSLLQHVLIASMNDQSVESSPDLPEKQTSEENKRIESIQADSESSENIDETVAQIDGESKVQSDEEEKVAKSPQKRRSRRNTPIANVHKTATNLFRRRSSGKINKPLWSEIVKKDLKSVVSSETVTVTKPLTKNTKKVAKKRGTPARGTPHHIDSPATIYIGRAKTRFQPTRTPRPSKTAAPVKLDLPLDESFGGVEEIFRTPHLTEDSIGSEDYRLYDDLHTPEGSMIVSPFATSAKRSSVRRRTSGRMGADSGASPDLCRARKMDVDAGDDREEEDIFFGIKNLFKELSDENSSDKDARDGLEDDRVSEDAPQDQDSAPEDQTLNNTDSLPEDDEINDEASSAESFTDKEAPSLQVRSIRPKRHKNSPVEENFGTKRLLKTPKQKSKSQPVDANFGLKRLMVTPKEKKKNEPVEEKLGTKRLLQTPKVRQPVKEPVNEHFGTKRLIKTPREKKNEPVSDHFGTKRLLQTPKEKQINEPVEEKFGTKRLMKTPKAKKVIKAVEEHFGTKRIFTTPVHHSAEPAVESKFGFTRIFHEETTASTSEAIPTEQDKGLDGLQHLMKSPKAISSPMEGDINLDSIMASPADWRKSLKLSKPEIAVPAGELAVPADDVAVPADELGVPAGELAVPADELAVPADELAVPADELAVPADELAVPAGELAVPAGELAVPADDVAVPADELAVPADELAVPADELAVPADELAVPADELAVPAELVVPADELAVPADKLAVPADELAVPADELGVPADELAVPTVELAVPAVKLTVPTERQTRNKKSKPTPKNRKRKDTSATNIAPNKEDKTDQDLKNTETSESDASTTSAKAETAPKRGKRSTRSRKVNNPLEEIVENKGSCDTNPSTNGEIILSGEKDPILSFTPSSVDGDRTPVGMGLDAVAEKSPIKVATVVPKTLKKSTRATRSRKPKDCDAIQEEACGAKVTPDIPVVASDLEENGAVSQSAEEENMATNVVVGKTGRKGKKTAKSAAKVTRSGKRRNMASLSEESCVESVTMESAANNMEDLPSIAEVSVETDHTSTEAEKVPTIEPLNENKVESKKASKSVKKVTQSQKKGNVRSIIKSAADTEEIKSSAVASSTKDDISSVDVIASEHDVSSVENASANVENEDSTEVPTTNLSEVTKTANQATRTTRSRKRKNIEPIQETSVTSTSGSGKNRKKKAVIAPIPSEQAISTPAVECVVVDNEVNEVIMEQSVVSKNTSEVKKAPKRATRSRKRKNSDRAQVEEFVAETSDSQPDSTNQTTIDAASVPPSTVVKEARTKARKVTFQDPIEEETEPPTTVQKKKSTTRTKTTRTTNKTTTTKIDDTADKPPTVRSKRSKSAEAANEDSAIEEDSTNKPVSNRRKRTKSAETPTETSPQKQTASKTKAKKAKPTTSKESAPKEPEPPVLRRSSRKRN